jgi:PncC family amidohydrolase
MTNYELRMTNTKTLSENLGRILKKKSLTLAVAESCTGGMIGGAITEIAGSSEYFLGGIISYDNSIKRDILGVSQKVLEQYGAVSGQTVIAMAKGVQGLMKADCAIAVSGVAGPGGGTKEKPVGLVYIGIAIGKQCWSFVCRFKGTRTEIRKKTVSEGLRRLIEKLKSKSG